MVPEGETRAQGRRPRPWAVGAILALAAVASLFVSGCTTSDVSSDQKIMDGVMECLPPRTPAPTLVSRAIWFPHARGVSAVESWNTGYGSGVLAWADGQLWFMTWNDGEKHYDMQCVLPLRTANRVYLDGALGSLVLVIQSQNLSSNAFKLMGRGNIRSDPQRTREWLAAIEAWRAAHPLPTF
jgi:hypothetical protein